MGIEIREESVDYLKSLEINEQKVARIWRKNISSNKTAGTKTGSKVIK